MWSFGTFLPPPPLPNAFIPPLTQCDGFLDDCMVNHGLVAGIINHGSRLLSMAWVVTVEAPGLPQTLIVTQLNVVVTAVC